MKHLILLLFVLLGFGVQINAQEEGAEFEEDYAAEENYEEDSDYIPMFSLGLEFDLAIPQANFRDNLDGVGVGVGGNFLVRTNRQASIPVLAGISSRIVFHDRERQDQIVIIDGESIDGRFITRNNIFMIHGMMRVLPPVNSPIQPFIDGMVGFRNFYTRTILQDLDSYDDDTIDSYIEQGDWAFSFGGAVGFQVLIRELYGGYYILLEGRCSYLKGSAADYLARRDDPNVPIVDTIDAFEEKNSTTDMLIPQIGVSFVF